MIKQFAKRLADLEKNKNDQENWQESYNRMKMLIDSLQSERDMLRNRLLQSNLKNFVKPIEEQDEIDPMLNQERDIYLWNTGIICSATPLTKVIGTDDGRVDIGYDRTNRHDDTKSLPISRIFSTNYVC
jgi:hypothetical protein